MTDLLTLFRRIDRNLKILVLGDIMLDRYTWGDAERISPEAPVIVLRADQEEIRPGGAASVAYLLKHLDAEVTLAGIIGSDSDGHTLRALLRDESIDDQLVMVDPTRPTTAKHRFVGRASDRHPHQILRVDHESRAPLSAEVETKLWNFIEPQLNQFNAILIADYLKGVCTESLLQQLIKSSRANGQAILIDPGRDIDFHRYRGTTLIKPNRVEAEFVVGQSIATKEQALEAAARLRDTYATAAVIITLDRDGLVVVSDGSQAIIPTDPRSVYDITGAGDMVLAMLGLCLGSGVDILSASRIANIAAGLEVERFGIAPVKREEIETKITPRISKRRLLITQHQSPKIHSGSVQQVKRRSSKRKSSQGLRNQKKIVSIEEITQIASEYHDRGKRIVFTNGCFDLLHVGHINYLQEASLLGDVLIVAVNSDESVGRLKGPSRPIISDRDRVAILAALECIDHVLIFEEDTPHSLLQGIRPDVLVKGGTTLEIVGREIVTAYGGQVIRTQTRIESSTTDIIESVVEARLLHQ